MVNETAVGFDEANGEEITEERAAKMKFTTFVETTLVDFFSAYKLERLAVEDGNGGKAKLSTTKDGGIKIELSSTTII